MPPMPGDRNAVGGGVRNTGDGRGDFLTGDAVGLGTVHGVQGGDGDWVAGGPYEDAAWEGSGWETALRKLIPRWGVTYLQDGIPDRRGTAEVPSSRGAQEGRRQGQ